MNPTEYYYRASTQQVYRVRWVNMFEIEVYNDGWAISYLELEHLLNLKRVTYVDAMKLTRNQPKGDTNHVENKPA